MAEGGWPGPQRLCPGPTLTTARCPFLALVMSSSEPGVKSMMPSLPGPPANVMLERSGHVRPARCACTARSGALPASPALVDVDVVHSVSAEGRLGQGLDHVVTLQHHVPLGAHRGTGSGPAQRLEGPCPPRRPVPEGHLLLIVLTLHVEHKEAVAQAADGDPWGGKGRGQGSRSKAGPPLWTQPGLGLTSQVGVLDPLLNLSVLHDDHGVGRQQQLPGARLVALAVVLHDGHSVLGTEGE